MVLNCGCGYSFVVFFKLQETADKYCLCSHNFGCIAVADTPKTVMFFTVEIIIVEYILTPCMIDHVNPQLLNIEKGLRLTKGFGFLQSQLYLSRIVTKWQLQFKTLIKRFTDSALIVLICS